MMKEYAVTTSIQFTLFTVYEAISKYKNQKKKSLLFIVRDFPKKIATEQPNQPSSKQARINGRSLIVCFVFSCRCVLALS